MISHALGCIFVHIPRTARDIDRTMAGGRDWWQVEPSTKHFIASQARRAYKHHWDDYFTFSIVRDPWDRMVSCLHFAEHFGIGSSIDSQGRLELDLSVYYELFGTQVVLEHDHRFVTREALLRPKHRPNTVYGNILDEELDFVGRMEDLPSVVDVLRSRLHAPAEFEPERRSVASTDRAARLPLAPASLREISRLFAEDIELYGYEEPDPS